jgi:ribosomal protein S18 acetylase RimI-like enzyme
MDDLPAPLLIRRAGTSDLDAIADLHTQSRTAYYHGFVPDEILADPARAARRRAVLARDLRSDSHVVLCAGQGRRLSGFASIGPCALPDPDPQVTSQLGFFYVDPASFRQRIGTRLHQACIQAWQQLPATAARVWVMEFNQRARAFYASQGWEPDGHHHPDDPSALGYRLTIPQQAR